MRDRPLVSVAMCTYNGARFLKEQLDSILAQSYPDIEIIITDDGSADDTPAILAEYAARDARVRWSVNEVNLGFVKNFEKAISLCSGRYIALADQDDLWDPRKIERFVETIGMNAMIYSDAELIDAEGKPLGSYLIRPGKRPVAGSMPLAFILDNCVSGNTLMFERSLLPRLLPIPEGISFHDQWIAFAASASGTIVSTEEALTRYRRYDAQVTHNAKKKARGFAARLKEKRERKIAAAEKLHRNIRAFRTLPADAETEAVLDKLEAHYEGYVTRFYNVMLLIRIWGLRDRLFAMEPSMLKRVTRALKLPMGLRCYEATLFTL